MPDITIASFVLRFIQEEGAGLASTHDAWRGLIRHVQSEQQQHFKHIEDALAFMGQFVELEREANEQMSNQGPAGRSMARRD